MSKKLKTLKDLKIPELKWESVDRKKLCSRIELKQEAIKWIKELIGYPKVLSIEEYLSKGKIEIEIIPAKNHTPCIKNITKDKLNYFLLKYKFSDNKVIEFIKYFFNISDKEVRENE